jgi:hypothetical protein
MVERFFWDLSQQRLRRGAFHNVDAVPLLSLEEHVLIAQNEIAILVYFLTEMWVTRNRW